MFNSLDVLDDLVPVSELSNGRTGAVLSKADRAPVIIIKRNKPSYVLMDGRKVPVTDVEIEAAAKYLKANPGLFGPSACFIDPNRFEEIARSVLQAARNAVGKDME